MPLVNAYRRNRRRTPYFDKYIILKYFEYVLGILLCIADVY